MTPLQATAALRAAFFGGLVVLLVIAAGVAYYPYWRVIPKLKAQAQSAQEEATQARADLTAAKASYDALQSYAQQVQIDQPAVDDAAARILRQCAPAALPAPARRPHEATPAPQNPAAAAHQAAAHQAAADQAFAAALAEDLATCSQELARFSALQQWADAVSTP